MHKRLYNIFREKIKIKNEQQYNYSMHLQLSVEKYENFFIIDVERQNVTKINFVKCLNSKGTKCQHNTLMTIREYERPKGEKVNKTNNKMRVI